MTGEDARQALTTQFITEWEIDHPSKDYFIVGNAEPDLTSLDAPFAVFGVSLPAAEQAELAVSPMKRYTGTVEIGLFVPEGGGTKPFFEMYATIERAFVAQTIGGIRMTSAVPLNRQPAVGWQSKAVLVNYTFDSIT